MTVLKGDYGVKPSWMVSFANHPQPKMKITARGILSRYLQDK